LLSLPIPRRESVAANSDDARQRMAPRGRPDRDRQVVLEVDVDRARDVARRKGRAAGIGLAELEPAIGDPPVRIGQVTRELGRREERGTQPFFRPLHLTRHGRNISVGKAPGDGDGRRFKVRALAGHQQCRACLLAARGRNGALTRARRPPGAVSLPARLK
jgi:hypothetical protein